MSGDKKAKPIPLGICTHCGAEKAVTDDHIPPKCLFPASKRKDLITVPSCLDCNRGASKDDEHFRLMLTMRADTSELPAVQEVLEKVWRSLARPEASGLATSFVRNFVRREVVTPSGISLGEAPTFIVDRERLARVVNRTVKGLFFTETNCILPNDYEVSCLDELRVATMPAESMLYWERICKATAAEVPRIVCPDVFQYWSYVLEEDPNVSSWLLLFYGCVPFFCTTTPRAMHEHIEDRLRAGG